MTTNDYIVCEPTGHYNKWLESESESVITTRPTLSTHSWALYHSIDSICILYIIARIIYQIWILNSSVYLQQKIWAVMSLCGNQPCKHYTFCQINISQAGFQESGWIFVVLQWNATYHNALQLYIVSLLCSVLTLFLLLERTLPETVC